MHHFSYVGGVLHAEGVSLGRIAEAVGTPFYCYSTATLERHYRVLQDAFAGGVSRGPRTPQPARLSAPRRSTARMPNCRRPNIRIG